MRLKTRFIFLFHSVPDRYFSIATADSGIRLLWNAATPPSSNCLYCSKKIALPTQSWGGGGWYGLSLLRSVAGPNLFARRLFETMNRIREKKTHQELLLLNIRGIN